MTESAEASHDTKCWLYLNGEPLNCYNYTSTSSNIADSGPGSG